MFSAYQVSRGENVLLLGEGNFSFCKDFIILNENLLVEEFSTIGIVASCKESQADNFSDFMQENINFTLSKGVTVHYNVDATNLKCHPVIKDQKYDKIIFNFPHVGGKMKIHLNRKLLKDFFSSACDVLNEGGSIVVALCDGQGGTEADKKQRSWNDSWQITEMAAQSDLILYRVEPFDVKCFPNYVNVGYRSCEKSFHCENAIVHVFRRHKPPRILQEDPDTWTRAKGEIGNVILDALETYLHIPWSNLHSASSFVFQKLLENMATGSNFIEHKSIMRYSFSVTPDDTNPSINSKGSLSSLLGLFKSVSRENNGNCCIVLRGLMIKKSIPLKDFSSPPVRCQVLIFGHDLSAFLHQYLTGLLELFEPNWQVYINVVSELLECNVTLLDPDSNKQHVVDIIQSVILPNGVPCHLIHVDKLAQTLFKIKDWRSLWDGSVDTSSPDMPLFYPTVMFPKEYAFDLGLSVPLQIKDRFEEEFYLTLWLLAGDIIVKVEHLTTYEPTDRELICYCYRITYKSCSAPLHKKRVVYFHEKIIAKVVSRILQVNIT